VPSHLIRLRKAWVCQNMESPSLDDQRLELPLTWPPDPSLPQRARLTRTFSAPPIEATREHLAIRFERVPGLRSICLNRQPIHIPDPIPDRFEIATDMIEPRNCLVLEVEFIRETSTMPSEAEGWGSIALVIRSQS
jgi:hypothetical protein